MRRVTLAKTGIADPKTFDWIAYFQYNQSHLLKLDFQSHAELTEEEKTRITPSIRAFQIGEGSNGTHLKKAAEKYAARSGYREYPEIMRWFIAEENRHSQTLKRYMQLCQIEPVKTLWIDHVFRFLRKLTGLECEVVVLVTAEMIALSYYTALSRATNSQLLQTICDQMLHDELRHVILQSDTLHRIYQNRSKLHNQIYRAIRKLLMEATVFVVWRSYQDLFQKGNYTYQRLRKHCMAYLYESIHIEKTGKVLS